MEGTLLYSFTPAQLVNEMLKNFKDEEVISERESFKLFGQAKIKALVESGRLTFEQGSAPNSPKMFKRKEIERLFLESKYINTLKFLTI